MKISKARLREIVGSLISELESMYDYYIDNDAFGDYITDILDKEEAKELGLEGWFGEEDDEDEEELTDEDYEDQFGSEMAIRICRANNIPLSDIEKYGSDAYWINDGINNLQDLYDINESFVIPTGDEDLIRDYREEILEEDK